MYVNFVTLLELKLQRKKKWFSVKNKKPPNIDDFRHFQFRKNERCLAYIL